MKTTVDNLTLRKFTAVVRIVYRKEQLAENGISEEEGWWGRLTKTFEAAAPNLEEARGQVLRKAARMFPHAGLVIKCITMKGK